MISKSYSLFFRELEENNHTAWFKGNKQRFEEEVKIPFLDLVERLIAELLKLDAEISTNPKEALFRLNKDLRFTKDQQPYHTLMKAAIAPGGKRSGQPGYYLGIGAHSLHVGGGLFRLDSKRLARLRERISDDPSVLPSIVEHSDFISFFGALQGERAKRLPKAYQPYLAKTPYLAHKQYYAMQELELNPLLDSDKLVQVILERFKVIARLNAFLKLAMP